MMRTTLAVLLTLLLAAPAALAQNRHVAPLDRIDALIAARQEQERADRDVVTETLRIPEVRRLADAIGVPMDRAEAAIATLEGDRLTELAAHARASREALAGGATTITISSTVIIIALLLIILIIVAD